MKGFYWSNALLAQLNSLSLYLAISSTTFGALGLGGTEPTDSAYGRLPLGLNAWAVPSNGQTSNRNLLQWARATQSWFAGNPMLCFALFDSATIGSGNLYITDALPLNLQIPVTTFDQPGFAPGALILREY